MYFENNKHKIFYEEKIEQVKNLDTYIKSLIYLISSNEDTRKHFEDIYDIKNNEINLYVFKAPWQTNTSLNITRLAFNLFGDLVTDNIEEGASYLYSISSIFKNINLNTGIEAIKIRFDKKLCKQPNNYGLID